MSLLQKICPTFRSLSLSPRPTKSERSSPHGNGRVKDWTSPAHDFIEMGEFPSLLSCVHSCPAPPVSTHAPFRLPCRNDVNLAVRPTWSTLISLRCLNHWLTQPAPDTTSGNLRPCAVSLTLRYSSHVGQRLCAHVFRYVQGSRRGIVSSTPPRADFRGKNTEAPPLPVLKRFYRFGSVSAAALLARARAPFIVELFMVRFFRRIPGSCLLPADRCCHRQTPDASVR